MRHATLVFAAVAALAASPFLPNRAEALNLPAPARIAAAIAETSLAESVAWRCTRWWNGRWHHWARCAWVPRRPIYYGHRAYVGPPIYRGHWRAGPRLYFGHRHLRHHRYRFWR
jgi:hypothetical protein